MSARILAIFVPLAALVQSTPALADDEIDICIRSSKEGQLLRDADRLQDAMRSLDRCAQASCPSVIARDCSKWRGEVEVRIPGIVTTVREGDRTVSDASITIDKNLHPRVGERVAVEPGTHMVEVVTPSGRRNAQTLDVHVGETKHITIQLERPILRDEPKPTQSVGTGSLVLWALGGASLLGAGVVGAYGYQTWQDLYDRCEPRRCFAGDAQRANTAFLATDVLWISGLALAGVGTLLFLLQDRTPPPQASGAAWAR